MQQEEFKKIIEMLREIPGISNKQAKKIVTFFLENPPSFTKNLFEELVNLQQKTKKCKQCLAYTENEICNICLDKKRVKKLFVVSDSQDIEKFESLEIEKGKYFVFNENINLKKISDSVLNKISLLLELINEFDEIIVALNTDLNGQITMKYIEKQIRYTYPQKNVYQLSIGIPFGMSIEAIDSISLTQSILNKKKL
ncbi:Recombination protein R [Metamycoplasma alkalescens 14918]|uniref:Recombination protein RecR n=1 Tax=Metamycoplasma alkalescens 14918 TaxID=1188234 RepID=N9U9Q1_9BACT|nr:toprim domain-containing protein [Metamycoplasma alkalescens]ENY53653.1 Recombination protein R [Metamycoplasma alkalescens 14918]